MSGSGLGCQAGTVCLVSGNLPVKTRKTVTVPGGIRTGCRLWARASPELPGAQLEQLVAARSCNLNSLNAGPTRTQKAPSRVRPRAHRALATARRHCDDSEPESPAGFKFNSGTPAAQHTRKPARRGPAPILVPSALCVPESGHVVRGHDFGGPLVGRCACVAGSHRCAVLASPSRQPTMVFGRCVYTPHGPGTSTRVVFSP
jgi:hypothetical protein